jgi:hypothetical protein
LVEVDYDVCEDAEEVEGDEAEDGPVLGARGEEVRDFGFAAVVDDLEAAAAGLERLVVAVGGRGGVGGGLVVEEGLGGGDFFRGIGGGHYEVGRVEV